ncbi:MAG TPA: zinc-ribbon domain-containing protein [Acidobacteriota bacterium]|nr:zinc-ribbon domain-containing protein [Acidobacteriota bacterium]
MAFCSKCGSAVTEGAAFCGVCGSPVAAPGGQAAPPVAPPPAAQTGAGIGSNVAGALCYLLWFVTGIIFLVVEPYKNDAFVRFHAFQAIAFSVVALILEIIWHMFVSIGFLSFGILFVFVGLVGFVIWLAIIVYWIFLMYKAYNNETYKIPVLGEWASKQVGK